MAVYLWIDNPSAERDVRRFKTHADAKDALLRYIREEDEWIGPDALTEDDVISQWEADQHRWGLAGYSITSKRPF